MYDGARYIWHFVCAMYVLGASQIDQFHFVCNWCECNNLNENQQQMVCVCVCFARILVRNKTKIEMYY